jgi:hypothetical protein
MSTSNFLGGVFGQMPSYMGGLLSPEEQEKLKQEAQNQGVLNLGLSLLAGSGRSPVRRTTGELVAQGLQAGQQAYRGATQQALQDKMIGVQLEEAARKRQQQEALRTALPNLVIPGQEGKPPAINQEIAGQLSSILPPGDFEKLMGGLQKQFALSQGKVGKTSVQSIYDPATGRERKVVVDEAGNVVREIGGVKAEDVKPQRQVSIMDIAFAKAGIKPDTPLVDISQEQLNKLVSSYKEMSSKPEINISMGEGQKGFENEMKLSSGFKNEPVYKAFQEVKSAYGQITKAIDLRSPAGDLAAATKIMKLLDPGSVVRESELGMAMQATGLMDRITGYADNVIKGTKLTEQQRVDFRRLADALYGDAASSYNNKRGEYQELGQGYGLNTRTLGAPISFSAPSPAAAPPVAAPGQPVKPSIPDELRRAAQEELRKKLESKGR